MAPLAPGEERHCHAILRICTLLQGFEISLNSSKIGTSSAVTKARTRPGTVIVAYNCTVRGVGARA